MPSIVADFLGLVDHGLLSIDATDDGVSFVNVHANVAGFGRLFVHVILSSSLGRGGGGCITYRFGLVAFRSIPD